MRPLPNIEFIIMILLPRTYTYILFALMLLQFENKDYLIILLQHKC